MATLLHRAKECMDAATQTSNGATKVGALEAAPRELTDRLGVLEVAPAGLERNGIPPTPPI